MNASFCKLLEANAITTRGMTARQTCTLRAVQHQSPVWGAAAEVIKASEAACFHYFEWEVDS